MIGWRHSLPACTDSCVLVLSLLYFNARPLLFMWLCPVFDLLQVRPAYYLFLEYVPLVAGALLVCLSA